MRTSQPTKKRLASVHSVGHNISVASDCSNVHLCRSHGYRKAEDTVGCVCQKMRQGNIQMAEFKGNPGHSSQKEGTYGFDASFLTAQRTSMRFTESSSDID